MPKKTCVNNNNNNNNNNDNNNNTLYYSVKSSSKATQSSLIGDTDNNTGISLLLSTGVWVLLSPPIEFIYWTFMVIKLCGQAPGADPGGGQHCLGHGQIFVY